MLSSRLARLYHRRTALPGEDVHASYRAHHSQYVQTGKLEVERRVHAQFEADDLFNSPWGRHQDVIDANPSVRNTAIDIGSGTGFLSMKLSPQFREVISIEPSDAAVAIAGTLYPGAAYPNIRRMVGFAEEVLPTLSVSQPVFLLTSAVLSHLRDDIVERILAAVDKIAPSHSVLSFGECFGEEYHRPLWHVRTRNWWRAHLPDWELDFFGDPIETDESQDRHKGFAGVKATLAR